MSSSEYMMSYWLTQSNPMMLESPTDSADDAEDDDGSEEADSGSQSEGSKEYDDDDFDNRSLEIDEEERNKISAQINADDEEEEDVTEDEEKEEIIEKEDSGQEKNQGENDDQISPSHSSLCSDRLDDCDDEEKHQGHATAAGPDEGETSMTESAESRTLESYGLIQKLESERKHLLQELHRDEQQRQYFYNKLKTITQKMECLHQTEANGVQLDIARRQLEMEAYKVQEAMHKKLGLQEESKLRHDASLGRVQNIEAEIISLQMQARKTARAMADQKDIIGRIDSERKQLNSSHSAPLATQSGDAILMEIADGIAPGIPMSANHLNPYHSNWSLQKECGSLYSSLSPSQDLTSISFSSMNSICSMGGKLGTSQSSTLSLTSEPGEQTQNSGTKVEMVYSLLNMLGTHDKEDMSRTLFAMSQSQDNCIAMRQAGCLPLLLQVLHGSDKDGGLLGNTRGSKTARARASAALHNIVHCHHDDKRGRREARTLRLLEQIRAHCDQQRGESDDQEEETDSSSNSNMDHHPGAAIAALMKLSFDEDYRHAICTLGGLQAIAELLEIDNRAITPLNDYSTTIRRYSCMALTNLTFGDGKNKALLCSMRSAMEALTDQLRSANEDLIQAAASVLRNLSWRADLASKKTLREIGVVTTLMKAAMIVKKETTLKSILSALWNLSSHCSENKAEICAVEGALQFLVSLLTYKSTAKTLAIIENGGGILRNVSSHIAIREDYRQILRKLDCLKILLCHLKSPSLTIVSNACGTLWNLSARCEEDQNALRDMGAISMLRNLVHSRHKMISSGSSAALKNLLTSIPAGKSMDSDRAGGSPRPSLHVRRQRALEAELDHNLSETCENVDSPRNSPTEIVHRSESEPRRFVYHLNSGGSTSGQWREDDTRKHMTRRQMMPRNGFENGRNFETSPSGRVARAGSQDSVGSTHSDISHDRTRSYTMLAKTSFLLHKRQGSCLEKRDSQPGVNNGISQHSHPCKFMPEYSAQNGQPAFNSNSLVMAHEIPAHVSNSCHNSLYYQHKQGWQTMSNNHVFKHNHEVTRMSDNFQGPSSLTQSAPSHCQAFCQLDATNNRQQQQQSLLERLAKSSSGLSGSCNLNNSITLANNGLNGSIEYSNHLPLSITADGDSNQPVNYSMKYQDGVIFDRSSKLSPNSYMNRSYDPSTAASTTDFMLGTTGESLKSNLMNISMNERNYLKNNSIIHEKLLVNNRQSTNSSGTKMILNSTVATPHKPVPNLLHNHFHASEAYQPTGTTHNQPPQASYIATNPFNSLAYDYLCHPLQTSNQSLPSLTAAGDYGHAPNVKTCADSYDQFNPVHSSQMHLNQNVNTNNKIEPEFLVSNPTNVNHIYSESTAVNCSKKYQEHPVNFSMNFRNNERKDYKETESGYKDETHYAEPSKSEFSNKEEFGTISCNGNKIFVTEVPNYISTNTSLKSFSQTDRNDRVLTDANDRVLTDANDRVLTDANDRVLTDANGDDQSEDHSSKIATINENKINTNFKTNGYKREFQAVATLAGGQNSDRHIDVPGLTHEQDLDGYVKQQENICSLQETPIGCSGMSSVNIQNCSDIKEKDDCSKLNLHKEKVDETSIASRSSSSIESLSSCEADDIHGPDLINHCQMAEEIVPSCETLSMLSSPGKKSSPAKKLKDFFTAPKSRNVVTKQSLNFDKSPSAIKPESFISFAAFDEEDKPIHFTMKSQDSPLSQPFPRLEIGQAVSFSSFETEQELPHLTFSTFQKNFQPPPSSNQSNHFTNRICVPRAKALPTLMEQTSETEPLCVASEVPVTITEEKSLQSFVETTDQNISSTMSEIKVLNQQNENQNAILADEEEKQTGFKTFETYRPASFCVNKDTPPKVWTPKNNHENQDVLEPSESEESEVEEDIPKQKIDSSVPTKLLTEKMEWSSSNNATKKKSGIPMKMSPGASSKVPTKISSIPKPSLKKPISSPTKAGESKSNNTLDCSMELTEPEVSKKQIERQLERFESPYESQENYTSENQLYSKVCDENDVKIIDSKISSFKHKTLICAAVTPFNCTLPDTARIHYFDDDVKTLQAAHPFSTTKIDSEIPAFDDSAGFSRIPEAKNGFGYKQNVKSNISQKSSKFDIQTYMEHTASTQRFSSNTKSLPQKDTDKNNYDDSSRNEMEYMTSESSSDSLHVFDIEGEPITLSTDGCPLSSVDEKDSKEQGRKKTIMDKICTQVFSDDYSSDSREQHEIGQSNEEDDDDNDSEVRQKIFYLEDTTDCSSRNSSLHSLNNIFTMDKLETSSNEDLKKPAMSSEVDENLDINNCILYDSSSEKLTDYNSSTGDLTLLENSSLHKSKQLITHDNIRIDTKSRIPGPVHEREIESYYCVQEPVNNTSMNISNDYNSSSETDPESQSSLSNDQSSSENSMSQSCSDTPCLDLDLQIPPFLSRLSRCNTWCQQSNRCLINDDRIDYEGVNGYLIGDITPEETERLLTENVNLIMSEIQTTKMSGSSVDEDLFIENETISLVSNGYTSDTNSEVSVSWSVTSDKNSNFTVTRKQNQAAGSVRRCGPKFIKPVSDQSDLKKTTPEKDEVKTVRGRRKPLYPGKSPNAAVAVRGNIKTVAQKGNVVNVQAGSKIMTQNGISKPDANRSGLNLKKTPPKTSSVAVTPHKTVPVQSNNTKIKSPAQKIVYRRSRSAGPATSTGKNGTTPTAATGAAKAGSKSLALSKSSPQANQQKLVKISPKSGELIKAKSSLPANNNVSPQAGGMSSDQCKLSTAASVSPGHSRIPKGTSQGQSKIPSISLGNKYTNNVASVNNKKSNKPTGQASRSTSSSALCSAAAEKKAGQNPLNIGNSGSTNAATLNRNSDSCIPRRKSSGSSTSVNNIDSNKQIPSGKRVSPVIADSSKRTLPVSVDAKKNTSSSIPDSNKHVSPGVTNIYKRTSPNNTDINKSTSPNIAETNKRTSPNSTDPAKRMSPNSSDLNKRSSLGNAEPNKRSSFGNTDSSKRSSIGNADPNKRSSLGNTDSAKRTPTGVAGRKQSSSKIATLWKKDGHLERSPSRGSHLSTTASSPSSKLPVSVTKPQSSPSNTNSSNLLRQGFKRKAATLPNSSLASSKSRSFGSRISKSSTYEKISSELQGLDSKSIIRRAETVKKTSESNKLMKQTGVNCNSLELNAKQEEICDSSDDDDDDIDEDLSIKTDNIICSRSNAKTNSLDDPNGSLENVFEDSGHHEDVRGKLSSNHVDSFEQIEDIGSHIDSSTFRRKKRDPCTSDFDLPNADETCRSMTSLTDSHGSQQFISMSMTSFKSSLNADSFIRKMSIIDILESEMSESSEKSKKNEDEKSECKTKSTVAQGLKRLFSGRQKDKEKESKDKNKEAVKSRQYEKESKTKHSKSNSKHKKGGTRKRDYDFFRSNIKIEPSTTWTDEDCLVYNLETSSVPPIRQIPFRTDLLNPSSIAPVQIFSSQSGAQNFTNQSQASAQHFSNQSTINTHNYSNQTELNFHNLINHSVINIQNDEYHNEMNDGNGSSSEKHMTKTEMLLARRHKTNLSNSQSDLGHGEGVMKTTHAVTAV